MNLFDTAEPLVEELCDTLARGQHLRIERIVSWGQSSPKGFWYDQEEDEWVALLSGEAVVRLETHRVTLRAGDTLLLPAHVRHRVESTTDCPPCIWLCVFGRFEQNRSAKT